jgi:hypothetical protein
MTKKKTGNGHDVATVEMVSLLQQLLEEVRMTRAELTARLDTTNARIDALTKVTENAHRHIHERIDEAHGEAIANTERLTHPGGLATRVERLEAAVFKKTGS